MQILVAQQADAVRPVRAFGEKVFPLRSFCQLPMKAEVRLGASCIWSIPTFPMETLPTAEADVPPRSSPAGPTGRRPAPSQVLHALQGRPGDEGMLIAR